MPLPRWSAVAIHRHPDHSSSEIARMFPRWLASVALLAGFAVPVQAQPLAQPGPTEEVFVPPPFTPAAPPSQPGPAPPPAGLRPFQPPPGWFVGVEGALVRPNVSSVALWLGPDEPVPNLDLTVVP